MSADPVSKRPLDRDVSNPSKKQRKNTLCGKCGKPKKGHMCIVDSDNDPMVVVETDKTDMPITEDIEPPSMWWEKNFNLQVGMTPYNKISCDIVMFPEPDSKIASFVDQHVAACMGSKRSPFFDDFNVFMNKCEMTFFPSFQILCKI